MSRRSEPAIARLAGRGRASTLARASAAASTRGQRATIACHVHARRGRQHEVFVRLHRVAATHEDAAGDVGQGRIVGQHHRLGDGIAQRLQVVVRLRVDDDEIDRESATAPVPMRFEELAQRRQPIDRVDGREHDGEVAGDAVRPQQRLRAAIAAQFVHRRGERAAAIEQLGREVLEGGGTGGGDQSSLVHRRLLGAYVCLFPFWVVWCG